MRTRLGIVLVGLALATGGCAASHPSLATAIPTLTSGGGGSPSASAASPTISSGTEATMEPSATPPPSAAASAVPFTLTSAAFDDGAAIPRRHTCDGEDVSPDLTWAGVPEGAVSLALEVRDPDAGGFVHWLAYDIPASSTGGLPAAVSRTSAAPPEGANGFGRRGWGGPCPPSGTHHYVFTLSALDRSVGLTGGSKVGDLESAMRGHVIGKAVLNGTYRRG